MSSADDRESILSRVRGALAPLHQRAAMPDYTTEIAVMRQMIGDRDLLAVFTERIARVNGVALTDPAALVARLRENKWLHGYCDPALWPALAPHFGPDFKVETTYDRKRVDDYAFGITRAAGAIAETGTVVLNDATTSRRLGALTPWVHIAVVERTKIFADLPQAITGLGTDNNVIWVTGPSKTADVEGI
ncbi:MAG: LUD domain-containing protein, partial [Verrucomicrobia bacterium]|nr:LUD domain-containing protein [Verrucomicrobiota bacterium]